MNEITDEELQEIDGGATQKVIVDFSKAKSKHFIYTGEELVQNPNGAGYVLREGATGRQLQTTGRCEIKVNFARTRLFYYGNNYSKSATLVHCDLGGNYGTGWINNAIFNLMTL